MKANKTINLSTKTNLLEQDLYEYKLQDVSQPELFREIFPYNEVPKVSYNYRHVPMDMPEHIYITDTSFRDGQQSREPYTTQQMVDLYKMLHRLGGPNGIVRQTEFFVYSKKDRDALERCMELGYEFPEITTWIRATKSDFELVKNIGIRETGILVSCSDYHIFKKMNLTRKQALKNSAVRSYAMTGEYPEDLAQLLNDYHITYDKNRFIVEYIPNGSNLLPSISVIARPGSSKGGASS